MQVVRNWNQQKERTLTRKLREAVMAMAVDAHLGKDGVLQAYLDTPYLGQRGGLSICGFQAAAHHYFGKDAAELDLAEAATLAAILPSPGKLGPDRAPVLAKQKRDRVLETMKTMGYEVDAALAAPVHTVPPGQLVERFPAYLSMVRAALEATLPMNVVQGAGLEVTAAIDLYMQIETEKLLPEKTRYLSTLVPKQSTDVLQTAGIVLDVDTGRVRAVYGGEQASSTDFNRATQSLRQGGSAFKPVLYALALSLMKDGKPRFTPASIEPNMPRVFKTPQGDWRPRNVAGEYSESAALAQGMAWSMNLVTAALLEDVGGPRALIEFAAKAGFDVAHFPEEMGVGLGQGEVPPVAMAELAAMIAGGGRRVRAKPVLSVKDFRGIERWPEVQDEAQVLTPEAAAVTRELMRGVVDFGTGGAVRGAGGAGYVGPMIGKTGTTDEEKDLWFMGATPRYASVVWMGYDRPARIGAAASDFAAPLWGWWMNKLTRPDGKTPPVFPAEPKLVRRAICSITGKLGGPGCHAIPASFVPGTQPKIACTGEHAPDPIAEMLAGAREVNGKPVHESLWKRLAREKAEAAAGAQ